MRYYIQPSIASLTSPLLKPPPLAPSLAHVVYSGARMKLSLVRLVATLLLSGQMLPVGLPLWCDQVQRATEYAYLSSTESMKTVRNARVRASLQGRNAPGRG